MKKIFLSILLTMLFIPATLAIDVKTIKKEKKELIKLIKKKYSCKKVIPVVSDDGSYYYFQVVNKTKDKGVVDNNGNLIVPMEYDDVAYLPPIEEGVSKVPCRDGHSRKKVIIEGKYAEVYHKKAAASFFASNYTGFVYIDAKTGDTVDEYVKDRTRGGMIFTGCFYNLSGKKTASHKLEYPCVSIIPGLVVVDRFLTSEPMYGDNYRKIRHEGSSMSIFYNDGTPIAENIKYFNFIANDEIEYKKNVDGITRVGRYDLRNPQESIPCNYLEIKTMDNIVYVKQSALDEFVPYSAELGALGITYRDEGEKLFNQEKWDDVINYYANNGIDAPWGSYISAEALYQKAEEIAEWIMIEIGHYDNNPSNTLYRYDDKSHNPRNLEVANECHKTAHKLNSMYLSGSDTIYLKNARVLQEKLNENIAQFAVNKAKYAQVLKNTQAKIDAQKAQQQQMILSILSATTNALSQAASNSQSSYNKSGTVYKSNNTTTVKQNNAKTQSNSNSQSKSDDDYYEYECKHCDGTGRIVRHEPLHSSSFGIKIDKVKCPECGKTYDKNEYVHKHEICPKCKGKGKFREKL